MAEARGLRPGEARDAAGAAETGTVSRLLLEKARITRNDLELMAIRAYADPGLLHSLATCHEKLGDLAKARERNAEMLTLWARADPDLPLLIEAKALQARLASSATAAPPSR